MARVGPALILIGLALALLSAARLGWMTVFEPTVNDAATGFWSSTGIWGGAILAAVGAVFVAQRRGKWTPPL